MITDALVRALLWLVNGTVGHLPAGAPITGLPDLGRVWALVAQVDSAVPVVGPLQAAGVMVALVVVFLLVRLVLLVRYVVLP